MQVFGKLTGDRLELGQTLLDRIFRQPAFRKDLSKAHEVIQVTLRAPDDCLVPASLYQVEKESTRGPDRKECARSLVAVASREDLDDLLVDEAVIEALCDECLIFGRRGPLRANACDSYAPVHAHVRGRSLALLAPEQLVQQGLDALLVSGAADEEEASVLDGVHHDTAHRSGDKDRLVSRVLDIVGLIIPVQLDHVALALLLPPELRLLV